MRRAFVFAGCLSVATALAAQNQVQVMPPWPEGPPTFRLFFLGHEIGTEHDVRSTMFRDGTAPDPDSKLDELNSFFRFVDRGTTVELRASLDLSALRKGMHLTVKGRNYRLFSSDSEVVVRDGRAHVRDLTKERDIDLAGKPFFPIDNYAPIGVQEDLIKFWIAHGRPTDISAAPSGPVVRITSRGNEESRLPNHAPQLERLSIDGVVWGTETAWIDARSYNLIALTTWAGALPFEAVADGWQAQSDRFIGEAVKDRIDDLEKLTTATSTMQRGSFALVGATVITGTDAAAITNATVVVRDNRIAAVGPSASTPVPSGVPVTDAKGMTIVPGLWDMHAHAGQTDWAPVYLASGVTTIRDMGGEEAFLVAIRDAIDSGQALGPRYLLAGLVDGPGPHAFGKVVAGTPEEGVAVTRKYHDEHFQEMKLYNDVKADVGNAIIAEAHRLGMTVTGHVPTDMRKDGVGGPGTGVVEAGFDGIAHMQLRGESGSDASKAQIAFFKAHHTVMDPTESWNELSGHPASIPLEELLPGVNRLPTPLARMFASMSWGNGDPAAYRTRQTAGLMLLKDAVDAGLLVVTGTDKGVPGFSLPREIELYVQGGMTPLQAIQAATIMPAKAMRIDKEVGTLEVGKRADLVVLTGNPLENIRNIRSARWVVANGRMYDCDVLWRAAGYGPVTR
ncbi:MAG TPA: amidohydrolase family protein [Vicinamibacterales bacterium]|nr:amidohydrolase family protein [Vicinamibacterales bacterium]